MHMNITCKNKYKLHSKYTNLGYRAMCDKYVLYLQIPVYDRIWLLGM